MARVTIDSAFNDFHRWPGHLLEWRGGEVNARTAGLFSFTHGADSEAEGIRIEIRGTGLVYDNGEVIDGTIRTVEIFDDAGRRMLSFSNFAAGTLANDAAQLASLIFGSTLPDAGPGPDGKAAFTLLMSGNDIVTGSDGHDRGLAGLDSGNDRYDTGFGDDYMLGGAGNDSYFGGDGYDMLSYDQTHYNEGLSAIRGVTANVNTGVVLDPWGGTDRIDGIEDIRGSRFDDTFIGNFDRNTFAGLRGRDTFNGGTISFDSAGNRTGDHRDRVSYQDDYWQGGSRGIIVDLERSFANGSIRGVIRDGFGNLDTVIDIERVIGTRFDDSFVGSRENNQFAGAEGVDSYRGEDGFDAINFGYWSGDTPVGAVRVDLSRTRGQVIDDGFGNAENAIGIESLFGTENGDWFKGDANDNEFEGYSGADTMAGGGGTDTFAWIWEGELGQGDRVTDFRSGTDKLAFEVAGFQGMTDTVTLVNGKNATAARGSFVFDAATDTLFWDRDGNGAAAKIAVAVLAGVNALAVGDFDMWI